MAQIFTGAKARLEIGGQVIGFAQGVNVNQEDTITDVSILGQLEVGDLAEVSHKVNFSITYFKANNADNAADNQTAISLGFGVDEATGLDPRRNSTYFDVIIYDDVTDEQIYKMVDCKWEGGSGQVDAEGIWNGTFNFRARKGFGL